MQARDQNLELNKPDSNLRGQVPPFAGNSESPLEDEIKIKNSGVFHGSNTSDSCKSARVKTRFLSQSDTIVPTREQIIERNRRIASSGGKRPVGSVAIIEGPGRGAFFDLPEGFARIGRGANQEIQLKDDDYVSRETHAIIGYVPGRKVFFIFDGGRDNPVWVNEDMVLDAIMLKNEDIIKIGATTLLFMAF